MEKPIEEMDIREKNRAIWQFMLVYAKNPIQGIKKIPKWDWSMVLGTQVVFAIGIAILSGLISGKMMSLFLNIFFFPVSSIVTCVIASFLLQKVIAFLYRRNIELLDLYLVVALASFPIVALKIFAVLKIPTSVIGMLVACVLTSVGLVENFALPKKGVLKVLSTIFGIFFLSWMVSQISLTHNKETLKDKVTPESLDILQRELTGDQ